MSSQPCGDYCSCTQASLRLSIVIYFESLNNLLSRVQVRTVFYEQLMTNSVQPLFVCQSLNMKRDVFKYDSNIVLCSTISILILEFILNSYVLIPRVTLSILIIN